MEVKNVVFKGSFPDVKDCPEFRLPDYAFVGRSNVGKSSLVNMLCGRTSLARVSGQPGKTQLINYFEVDETWNLVDLPGYGYAKVSKKKRQQLYRMVSRYLDLSEWLQCTFLLIDSNVKPQAIDIDFANWMGEKGIPFALIFTKVDKLKDREIDANVAAFHEALLEHWSELPPFFLSSSVKKTGRTEILNYIGEINNHFYNPVKTSEK